MYLVACVPMQVWEKRGEARKRKEKGILERGERQEKGILECSSQNINLLSN